MADLTPIQEYIQRSADLSAMRISDNDRRIKSDIAKIRSMAERLLGIVDSGMRDGSEVFILQAAENLVADIKKDHAEHENLLLMNHLADLSK